MHSQPSAGSAPDPNIDLSVVIPVYNSSGCLVELLKELSVVLGKRGRPFEVILVDDASPDNSWEIIRELSNSYPELVAVRLMRNGGQARATLCGLGKARGRIVVTMDDDLQQPPGELPVLLDELEANPNLDCVFGIFPKKEHAFYRNLGSRAIGWVNRRAFGLGKHVHSSSFRAMTFQLASAVVQHGTENPAISALLYSSTRRVKSVPVRHQRRFAGKSNYTLARQMRLAMDNIVNVSMLPLRLVTSLGFGFCLLTVLWIALVLWRYLTGQVSVAGWTTVIILLSFFSGVILLSLGIIGEYLVRVLREVRRAPRFIVRETIERAGQGVALLPALEGSRVSAAAISDGVRVTTEPGY